MTQLIALKERIKVITNIQKTTHAMQLIAMSSLSRIAQKKKALQLYTQEFEELYHELGLTPPKLAEHTQKPLYIIIGSQKGFCGNFNNILFHYGKEHIKHGHPAIALGPYAYEFCKQQDIALLSPVINFTLTSAAETTEKLFELLEKQKDTFNTLIIISNHNVSLFVQKPQQVELFIHTHGTHKLKDIYATEQPHEEIISFLQTAHIKNKLYGILLESLRAENAARALSMDSSTRNARDLLSTMKLEYHKLRQAKITKELTELTASL